MNIEKEMYKKWLSSGKICLYSKYYGEISVGILYHGDFIPNNGPDFQNAKIFINGKYLVGDIEFHINSSDWFRHKHHLDKNYNNVILHIVYNDDSKIRIISKNNKRIYTYSISEKENNNKALSYEKKGELPCFYLFYRKNFKKKFFSILRICGYRKFLNKVEYISKLLNNIKNDASVFNKITYINILRGFGAYYNRDIFEVLAKYSNYKIIPFSYMDFIKKKLKFVYIRPYNNPYLAVKQFNNFLKNCGKKPFDVLLYIFERSNNFNDFVKMFLDYVNTGFTKKSLGNMKAKIILYNYFLPVLYFYSRHKKINKDKLLKYIKETGCFEKNFIIKRMKNLIKQPIRIRYEIMNLGLYYIYEKWCKTKECNKCVIYRTS